VHSAGESSIAKAIKTEAGRVVHFMLRVFADLQAAGTEPSYKQTADAFVVQVGRELMCYVLEMNQQLLQRELTDKLRSKSQFHLSCRVRDVWFP
jgi:hypothetical protein